MLKYNRCRSSTGAEAVPAGNVSALDATYEGTALDLAEGGAGSGEPSGAEDGEAAAGGRHAQGRTARGGVQDD